MNERKSVKTQIQATAKANLSERSERYIDSGSISVNPKKERDWKTRKDPLQPHAEDGEVNIFVSSKGKTKFTCPTCGSVCPGYDKRQRKWRHLDTC